jgi:hypothetical protein
MIKALMITVSEFVTWGGIAMALVKSHLPDFDAEILLRDFIINDEEWDVLVDSVYDTAQYSTSQYDFSVLIESDDNASPNT